MSPNFGQVLAMQRKKRYTVPCAKDSTETTANVKGMTNMLKSIESLNKYVYLCIIDEYADKCFQTGYSLDVDSLPDHEISNFLDELMKRDTNVRDYVLHAMQEAINDRLPECEAEDRENAGLTLVHMSNGDTRIERMKGY